MRRPLSHEATAGILLAAGCVLFFLPKLAFLAGWWFFPLGWFAAFAVWAEGWWAALCCALLSVLLCVKMLSAQQGNLTCCIFILAAAMVICFLIIGSAVYLYVSLFGPRIVEMRLEFLFEPLQEWIVSEPLLTW